MAVGTASIWLRLWPWLATQMTRMWLRTPRALRTRVNAWRYNRNLRRQEWQRQLAATKQRESLKGTRWMRSGEQ